MSDCELSDLELEQVSAGKKNKRTVTTDAPKAQASGCGSAAASGCGSNASGCGSATSVKGC